MRTSNVYANISSEMKNIRKFGEEIERLKLKQQILKRIKLENIIEEKTYIN